jgi:hypothetical protein
MNPIMIVIMAFLAIYVGYTLIDQVDELSGYNGSMAAGMGPLTLGIVALAAAIAVLVGVLKK